MNKETIKILEEMTMKHKIYIVAGILILVMIFSGYMLFRSGFQPVTNKMLHYPSGNGQYEPMPSDLGGGMSFPGGKTQRTDPQPFKTNRAAPLYPMITGAFARGLSSDAASQAVYPSGTGTGMNVSDIPLRTS